MNTTLNTFDRIFGALEVISDFDYVKFGSQIITWCVTLTAVIIGAATYAYTAFQLYWEDHGEVIKERAFRAYDFIETFTVNCYLAGCYSRPVANRLVAQLADRAFYALADCE